MLNNKNNILDIYLKVIALITGINCAAKVLKNISSDFVKSVFYFDSLPALFQYPAEHIDTEAKVDGPGGSGCGEGGMCHIEPRPDGGFGKTFQGLNVVH